MSVANASSPNGPRPDALGVGVLKNAGTATRLAKTFWYGADIGVNAYQGYTGLTGGYASYQQGHYGMAALQGVSGLLGIAAAGYGTRSLGRMIAADATMNPFNYRLRTSGRSMTLGMNGTEVNFEFVAPNSVLTRSQIITQAQEALGPLAKQFPDAKVGFRGSLARGTKGVHKGGGPFDPTNYDVDAFIVSDKLAELVPKNADGFRNLGRIGEHQSLIRSISDRLKAIPGHRNQPVKIRVFSEAEFGALSPEEILLLK